MLLVLLLLMVLLLMVLMLVLVLVLLLLRPSLWSILRWRLHASAAGCRGVVLRSCGSSGRRGAGCTLAVVLRWQSPPSLQPCIE